MKTSLLAAAAAAFLPFHINAASLIPRSSSTTSANLFVPPDLYAAEEPSFAGAPIVLSSPSDKGASSAAQRPWAMTYTPYTPRGTCKTPFQISADIASIAAKGFSSVRLYATDCAGPSIVGAAAAEHGLKLILGVYIADSGLNKAVDEQVASLAAWGVGNWDLVDMVIVGDESVFNGFVSAKKLAEFITEVKERFETLGYEGPVTTTEPLGTIRDNAETLCQAVDVVAFSSHPFWFADVSAENAGDFVVDQMDQLFEICGAEKDVVALECGWPSAGEANGAAVPGAVEQRIAVEAMWKRVGGRAAFVSFDDDAWRDPGDFGVEQHWGCGELFE